MFIVEFPAQTSNEMFDRAGSSSAGQYGDISYTIPGISMVDIYNTLMFICHPPV